MAKRGRKTKYTKDVCEKIIEAAGQGAHIPGMMVAAGIASKETWYNWIERHPEFKEAVERAKVISQAVYEQIGFKGTTGQIKGFNATSWAMIMNNKFGDEYKRNDTGGHTEVTINQLNLSPDQVEQKIQQKMERLKSLGIDFQNEHIEKD